MRGKLEAGYYIKTGQLENRPASWKLDKLEIFWPDPRAGNSRPGGQAGNFIE